MKNQPCIYCGKPLDYHGERCRFCDWCVRQEVAKGKRVGYIISGPPLYEILWVDNGILIVLSWEPA